jgi:hypothetical protein
MQEINDGGPALTGEGMEQYTKGPWVADCDEISIISDSDDQSYGVPVPLGQLFGSNAIANARRIMACVNACNGLSDNFLLAALNRDSTPIKSLLNGYSEDLSKAETESEQLLSSLKGIADSLRRAGANIPAPRTRDAIKDATTNGLSIALLLIGDAIENTDKKDTK